MRFFGLNVKHFSRRSIASGLAFCNRRQPKSVLGHCKAKSPSKETYRIHLGVLLLLLEWQSPQVVSASMAVDLVEIVEGRCAEHIENKRELMMIYEIANASA